MKYNHILYEFKDRFIDVAKLHYKKTGKPIFFVPLYIAPKLKTMYFGKPIMFNPDVPIAEERRRICDYLMKEITDIYCGFAAGAYSGPIPKYPEETLPQQYLQGGNPCEPQWLITENCA